MKLGLDRIRAAQAQLGDFYAATPLGAARNTARRIHAYEFRAGDPPLELKLWNAGGNPTDYGVHRWTSRSAQIVQAWYAARGNPLQIDVEHNCAEAPDPAKPPPTGGYAKLDIRAGEPWLVFDWSAYAVDQIRTRQRLYISPEYDVDKETGEIVRLVRVSLVANPGTHHARMLASANRTLAQGDRPMNLMLILAALRAALSNPDPEAAKAGIEQLIAEITKMAGSDGGGMAPEAAAAPPAPPAPPAPADDQTKMAAAAATDPKLCAAPAASAPVQAAAIVTPATALEVPEHVRRLAAAESKLSELEAKENERELATRISVLPESLHGFARTLTSAQFGEFVKTPEVAAAITAKAKVLGVRASGAKTNGANEPSGNGTIPAEDLKHLDRIFGSESRPTDPITTLPDGRVRATHMTRRLTHGAQK